MHSTMPTYSAHFTPRFQPLGMCVCVVFIILVLLPNRQFSTQLAPQEISSSLGASAEIQEQQGVLCLYCKAVLCIL